MNEFIDIFYVPGVDPRTPYRCFIWKLDSIVGATRRQDLATTAEWCKRYGMLVRTHDPRLRAELHSYGIEAHLATRERAEC